MSSHTASASDWLTMQAAFQGNANARNAMLSSILQAPSVRTLKNPAPQDEQKVYVEHNYVDHYNAPIYRPHDGTKRRGPRGGVLVPFPEKLYQMLNQISEDGLDDIVSWQPHGRCFVVHQPERFVQEVMPRYFSQTKLTSFQRQVNLYGFRRLTTGTDRNGYYHELFLRGRPDLLKRMTRVRVKGIGCKLAPSPATEPNFYRLSHCHKNKMATMLLTEKTNPPVCHSNHTMMAAQMNKQNDLTKSANGFLEAYMAGKLGQAAAAGVPLVTRPNSLFLQVSGRRGGAAAISSIKTNRHHNAVPCTPKSCEDTTPTPMPTFSTALPNFYEIDDLDEDLLTPLSTQSQGTPSCLTDMQDDIIAVLSSCGDGGVQPPRTSSAGNILSDMANFWDI